MEYEMSENLVPNEASAEASANRIPRKLTPRESKWFRRSHVVWIVCVVASAAPLWFLPATLRTISLVGYFLLAASIVGLTLAMHPWSQQLDLAVQYQRVKHTKVIIGFQALIPFSAMTIVMGFRHTTETNAIFTSALAFLVAALYFFGVYYVQVRMETPQKSAHQESEQAA